MGQVLFYTFLKFVWKNIQTQLCFIHIATEFHKVDGPHEGSIFMSTKWTNPTKVNCLTKSTKWTDPHEGSKFISTKWTDPTRDQDSRPQNGRTLRGTNMSTKWKNPTRVNCLTKSTKWTDPTRDQNSYPQSGRPHERTLLDQSTKWTDTYSNKCMDPWTSSIFSIFSEWTGLNEDGVYKHR